MRSRDAHGRRILMRVRGRAGARSGGQVAVPPAMRDDGATIAMLVAKRVFAERGVSPATGTRADGASGAGA